MRRYTPPIVLLFLLLTLPAAVKLCGNPAAGTGEGSKVEMRYATHLAIDDHDGYSVATIRNPWDTTRILQRYLMVEEGVDIPRGYDDAATVRVPLTNAVVFSAVHAALMCELGEADAVKGVCDADYIYEPVLVGGLADGSVADCGSSMSPNVEKIIMQSPGAVFISPFENATGNEKLTHAGIPVIECADYMETSPLARAEWMRFYGRLFCKAAVADSLFDDTERRYNRLKELASATSSRPKILLDRIYGQSWNLPGGNSTMGRMIEDAGGTNPFSGVKATGSLQLSPERVLYEAGDADIWLIRFAYTPVTLESLAAEKEMYPRFKAYREGRVYGSDTSRSHIFEDVAFHPHWILGSLISIFHPEVEQPDEPRQYFTPVM